MSAITVTEKEKATLGAIKFPAPSSNPAEARTLAMHAGELHGLIVERSLRLSESLKGKEGDSVLKAIEPVMVQLSEACQFSAKDTTMCHRLMDAVINIDPSDESNSPISKLYEELKADNAAHAVNLAIASIAHNSYETNRRHAPHGATKVTAKTIVKADVIGAVVGAIFGGFATWNPVGAIIGAVGIGAGASVGAARS